MLRGQLPRRSVRRVSLNLSRIELWEQSRCGPLPHKQLGALAARNDKVAEEIAAGTECQNGSIGGEHGWSPIGRLKARTPPLGKWLCQRECPTKGQTKRQPKDHTKHKTNTKDARRRKRLKPASAMKICAVSERFYRIDFTEPITFCSVRSVKDSRSDAAPQGKCTVFAPKGPPD